MKKLISLFIILFLGTNLFAQITVYEYKDDKAYCTFELDRKLYPDSTTVKGTYRAYQYYDILFFEMTFSARSTVNEYGETIITVTPDFYYHSYLTKLIGQREKLDPEEYYLTFIQTDTSITPNTLDEQKQKIYKKSILPEKRAINFTKMPETFTKVNSVSWGKFPSGLRKSIRDKDKMLGRKY